MYYPDCCADEEIIGLVIAVPEPWVSELTAWREQFGDPHGQRVPAHITLLPPTPIRKADYPDVVEHLRTVATHHCPFRVSLAGSGSFAPVSPVTFINVEDGFQRLVELENDVRSGILDVPTRFPYHPHVTIAQQVEEDALQKALELGTDFEASWTVGGFRLDRVGEDGSYQSRAIFTFGSPTG
ncbi:MAG: 2'-5' RNA ligase family protein [Actinomycetaceae bacterium]|nr:2'-5' RNA ligase family protein [Actinomycetaceae bacterium]